MKILIMVLLIAGLMLNACAYAKGWSHSSPGAGRAVNPLRWVER